MLVGELIGHLDLHKQRCGIELVGRTRFFMFSRLPQIRAFAGTIERNFTLFAATLRANAAVDRRAETFFSTNFADSATQLSFSCEHYGITARST